MPTPIPSAVVSVALIASLALGAPGTADAQTAPSTPVVTTRLPSATNESRALDIDGDSLLDALDVSLDDGTAAVTVTTGKDVSAARYFDVSTSTPFYGIAKLDGAKGSEVLVNVNDYELRVLRWRGGKLVDEPLAQSSPYTDGLVKVQTAWAIGGDTTSLWQTYHFFTSHGVRYVDAASLRCGDCERTGVYEKVTVVRSRWKGNAWHKVKVSVHRRITQKQAKAHYLKVFSGATVTK
ncbi:MAG TPA: hypothetical protein PKV13_04875 [Propionicimonas sp.]|nr:hypothetical protein [Propionicimonas sp.]HRA05935.1 hypothetical protein [Propionicimonas sp.]